MKAKEFDDTLRKLIYGPRFRPFIVELKNGNIIEIGVPGVAFGGGYAGYLSPNDELIDFSYKTVRRFRELSKESTS